MNEIQVVGRRGGKEIISKLILGIGDKSLVLPEIDVESQYNIRYIFEVGEITFADSVFGNKIQDLKYQDVTYTSDTAIFLKSSEGLLNVDVTLPVKESMRSIDVKIYHDKPVHDYGVLHTLPIPTEIITIYIIFGQDTISSEKQKVQKYFDGYSHLGFALVDIHRFSKILTEEYGDKQVDLIEEFSTTEIVDKLFDAGSMIITWGINPYTYPVYSAIKSNEIETLLGEPFDQKGIYNIKEDIRELTIIPGHELRNWPALLENDFEKITLFGRGNSVILQPYYLEDDDFEKVISSFLIYREKTDNNDSVPLLNIDLLY